MFKNYLFVILLLGFVSEARAQYTSIHHEQSEHYKQFEHFSEQEFDELNQTVTGLNTKKPPGCTLDYAVYGWHPYWVGTAYNNYDFNLLSTFSYFSYELDPCDGFKLGELLAKAEGREYIKAVGEDEMSMGLGIQGQKGNIHLPVFYLTKELIYFFLDYEVDYKMF